jgi:hypothetical protein
MSSIEDENIHKRISRLLKELPKVNAPLNFESELSRRINLGEQRKKKQSWIEKILLPKLVPSAALVVTAVIIFLLLKPQVDQTVKKIPVNPQLNKERLDEKIDLLHETKREKPNIDNEQKDQSKFLDISSEPQGAGEKSREEISVPLEVPAENQHSMMNKLEGTPPPVSSEAKTENVGREGIQMLQKTDREPGAIKMLKEKVDSTKDSSKNSRKINKF